MQGHAHALCTSSLKQGQSLLVCTSLTLWNKDWCLHKIQAVTGWLLRFVIAQIGVTIWCHMYMEALFSLLSSDNTGNTQNFPIFTECKSPSYYTCSEPCTFFFIFLFLLPTCINEVVDIGRKLHTAYTCYFRRRIPRRTWNKMSPTCFSLNPSLFSNGC